MEDEEKEDTIPYPARHIPSFGGAWGGRLFGRSFCQILSLLFFNLRPFEL